MVLQAQHQQRAKQVHAYAYMPLHSGPHPYALAQATPGARRGPTKAYASLAAQSAAQPHAPSPQNNRTRTVLAPPGNGHQQQHRPRWRAARNIKACSSLQSGASGTHGDRQAQHVTSRTKAYAHNTLQTPQPHPVSQDVCWTICLPAVCNVNNMQPKRTTNSKQPLGVEWPRLLMLSATAPSVQGWQ